MAKRDDADEEDQSALNGKVEKEEEEVNTTTYGLL